MGEEKEVHIIDRRGGGHGVIVSTLFELAVLYALYRAYRYFQEAEHERIKNLKTKIGDKLNEYKCKPFFGRWRDSWYAFLRRAANKRLNALVQDGTILEIDLKYHQIVEKP